MTKPNSKYFSSVIEKFIADKHKENIVIDDVFKENLRKDILIKSENFVFKDSYKENSGSGLFYALKYFFALMPAVLLVFILFFQVWNLPFGFKDYFFGENVVKKNIETFPGRQILEKITDFEGKLIVGNLDLDLSDKFPENLIDDKSKSKKIKTFPSYLIFSSENNLNEEVVRNSDVKKDLLPQVLNDKKDDMSDDFRDGERNDFRDGERNDFRDGERNDFRDGDVERDGERNGFRDGERRGDVFTPERYYLAENSYNNLNNYYLGNVGTNVFEYDGGGLTVNKGIYEEDYDDFYDDPFFVDDVDEYEYEYEYEPSLSVSVFNNDVVKPFNVIYEVSLNEDEKVLLEKNVILPFVEVGNVKNVVVLSDPNGFIEVKVFNNEGGSFSKVFAFNSKNRVWDNVSYVKPELNYSGLNYRVFKIEY